VAQQEQALTIATQQQLTPTVWEMIERVAPAMHAARLFGVSSKEQAMAIMLKGFEMGLSLTASFEFIQVVEGKPALSPRGALAMIHGSPLFAGIKIEDLSDNAISGKPSGCRVWMKRTNGLEYTVTWTMEDAVKAGVVKSGSGWEKYPANMLRWRAIGFCADVVFPDVIGGMKRADEYGADLTPDGNVIEGSWHATSEPKLAPSNGAPVVAETPAARVQAPTLDSLVQRYGAEAIMVANEGRIPGTDAELAAVAEKLAQSA
jgi:hypothetical protein